MIKVQHPEFETCYGGDQGPMMKMGYTCSDCHMSKVKSEDGEEFTDHNWTSPLENAALLEADCSKCHDDLAAEVKAFQDQEEERVTAISEKIAEFVEKFAAAKDSMSDEDVAKAQQLQREMQFYWDFVMVENSEGAHNPALTWATLYKAEERVDEGLAMVA